MADPRRRLPDNVPGDSFVDETCMDCDTCRHIAPRMFRDHGGQSSVFRQPASAGERHAALKALVACPTASIGGGAHADDVAAAATAYPERIADEVYFCGFTSEKSYGGWSYLIVRPPGAGGNVMVDSPRFTRPLVRGIRALGGVAQMLLTHRDDVPDHAAFAWELGCARVMHEADGASRLGAERILEGMNPVRLEPDLLAIPTPGHTRGHTVFLYRDTWLFTGDHLAWSAERGTLTAFPDVCWYSWSEQIRSMRRLLDHRFEWVLPEHGRMHRDTADAMQRHLRRCIASMEARPIDAPA